jgi:hypothetical protein
MLRLQLLTGNHGESEWTEAAQSKKKVFDLGKANFFQRHLRGL